MIIWVALVSVMGLAGIANATVRYADNQLASDCTSGNYSIASRNCTGSDGNAYNTFAEVIAQTVAGDTICVRSGTTWTERMDFQSPVSKTGTASAWITAGGCLGEKPEIRYADPVTAGSYGPIKARGNRGYFIFENMVLDGGGSADTGFSGWALRDGNHHFTLRNLEIKNFKNVSGLYISASDIIVQNCEIHDQVSTLGTSGTYHYAIYYHDGSRVVIEGNDFHDNAGGGMQLYPGPISAAVVRKNRIHDNNRKSTIHIGGIEVFSSPAGGGGPINGVDIHNNELYNNGSYLGSGTAWGLEINTATVSNVRAFNNTVYGNKSGGIQVSGPTVGIEIKNNLSTGNGGTAILVTGGGVATVSHNACTSAESCGSTSKLTITDLTSCTVSTSDFTQKAGSSCIDLGTSMGQPFNGAGPDIGAYEVFTFASCQVPFGAAGTIQVSFTSNLNLLGTTLTTFTARRNGASNALTGSATKIGDTIISLPLTTTYVGGDSADISWSSGGLTDNARIGGTVNQPFVQTLTNQSCTNNAGGAPAYVLTQKWVQYRGVVGPETTTDIRSNNTVQYEVQKGGAARVRFAITCTVASCPPTAFFLRYSRNSGPYTIVPDVFGTDNIKFCGTDFPNIGIENATPTTEQIAGVVGTFVPGAVLLTSTAIPTVSGLTSASKTEMEYCVSYDTDASGTYTFELYQQNGAELTYFQIADMKIVNPQSPAGF